MKNQVLRSVGRCLWQWAGRGGMCLLLALPGLPVADAAPRPPGTMDSAPRETEWPRNLDLVIGKSRLLRLPSPIQRIAVGHPGMADVTLINASELYILGKAVGATNVILWRRDGTASIIDLAINVDAERLHSRLRELMPEEKDLQVRGAAESIILAGHVSSAAKAERIVAIAEAYVRNLNRSLVLPVIAGDGEVAAGTRIQIGSGRNAAGAVASAGAQVINLLQVDAPQQVMLEVKVAEVSKTLLDKLGSEFGMSRRDGSWTYSILNSLLTDSAGILSARKGPGKFISIDAEKKDGILKILAEPNIVAISGQEGSFLAGGKIFIPVARTDGTSGAPVITLEEKEFGVGLKFTPTVLEGGRINLRVAPEVSELSQTGSPFTTVGNVTAILPSLTVRRAQTTVQLRDGQSFAIAGLIKNNLTETIKRLPALGEIPILGALFRSNEFQTDQSELMFVVTPRLVKPLPPSYPLPTDALDAPSRSEFFLEGRMEGRGPAGTEPADTGPQAPTMPPADRAQPND